MRRQTRPKPNRKRLAAVSLVLAITSLTSHLVIPAATSATSPPSRSELATGMAGVHGEVTRLYLALLDRSPEDEGLFYWASRRQDGASLRSIVAFFRNSPEFEARFGSMINASSEDWVDFIYRQVLGRDSDASGKAFWVELIDSGRASREDLIIHFSESAEFQIITGTGLYGFLHLVDVSEDLYSLRGSSYVYTADGSSFWGRETTTITVLDDVVVERSFELDWGRTGEIDEAWTETGDEIGSHDQGAPPATVSEVHGQCRDLLRTLDPIAHELHLWVDERGLLQNCGGIHLHLADAPHPMVEIYDFEPSGVDD